MPAVVASVFIGVRWLAEAAIGTVHVASDDPGSLAAARAVAHGHGGWLLREAGAPHLDGFGTGLPNGALAARVKDALDPRGVCNPGRLPIAAACDPPGPVALSAGSAP